SSPAGHKVLPGAERIVQVEVRLVQVLFAVVGLNARDASPDHRRMELRVAGQLGERIGGLLRAGDGGDDSAATERPVFTRPAVEQLFNRAHVGGHGGYTGGVAFEDDQRLGLADAGQHQNVHLAVVIHDVCPAGEDDVVFKA